MHFPTHPHGQVNSAHDAATCLGTGPPTETPRSTTNKPRRATMKSSSSAIDDKSSSSSGTSSGSSGGSNNNNNHGLRRRGLNKKSKASKRGGGYDGSLIAMLCGALAAAVVGYGVGYFYRNEAHTPMDTLRRILASGSTSKFATGPSMAGCTISSLFATQPVHGMHLACIQHTYVLVCFSASGCQFDSIDSLTRLSPYPIPPTLPSHIAPPVSLPPSSWTVKTAPQPKSQRPPTTTKVCAPCWKKS